MDTDNIESQKKTAAHFAKIFDTPAGEKVLEHLSERFFSRETTLAYDDEGRLDPVRTAAQEGQRSVVLYIQDMANFDFTAAQELIDAFQKQREKGE